MHRILVALLLLFTPCSALGQEEAAKAAPASKAVAEETKEPVTTRHEVTIGGKKIEYDATAGYMVLPSYDGKARANVFFISYTKSGEEIDPATRPILFAFNGGPGSSSVWLHLGAIGPRRVLMTDGDERPDEPALPSPPYRLAPNEYAWLDLADLVFIDPVGTGYSRPVEGESARQFQGLDEDIQAVGDFIRLYVTRHERWSSAKFLAGESYGTTRAAGLSGYLQDTHGMNLNGIVLISSVLNFQTIRFDVGNDTPYWLFLPTYTATAWYHRQLEPALQRDLEGTLSEVKEWARTKYLVALGRGADLTPAEHDEIATTLARYTGLSKDFVERSNLRIGISHFTKELLRHKRRTVGRLDSRYTGIDAHSVGSSPDFDPSYEAIQGPYTATLNDYLRRELGYNNDLPYEILTGRVNPWSYASASNRYANVGETLRRSMSTNRDLHVLFASGYYDLATPFFASDYTVSHLGLDPSLRPNVSTTYYESGHMMYIRGADLAKLKSDVAAFFARALRPAP